MRSSHQVLRFHRSVSKLLPIAFLAIAFGLGFGWMAWSEFHSHGLVTHNVWIGLGGFLFCALCSLIILRDMVFGGDEALILSPSGLTDQRVGGAEIPWSVVESIYEVKISAQKMICLRLRSKIADAPGSGYGALARGAKRGLGLEDVAIQSSGLNVSHKELLQLVGQFWQTGQYAPLYASQPSPRSFRSFAQ